MQNSESISDEETLNVTETESEAVGDENEVTSAEEKTTSAEVVVEGKTAIEKKEEENFLETWKDKTSLEEFGLTERQKNFVVFYVKNGGNGTKAIMEAYGTEDLKTAGVMSAQNLAKVRVAGALKWFLQQVASPSMVLSKFTELATSAKSQDTQLRAADLLAKVNRMYEPDTQAVSVNFFTAPQVDERKRQVVDAESTEVNE